MADHLEPHVTDTIHDSHGATIRAFLANPLNKNIFLSFFRMTYSRSVVYLRYLKSKGFQLPLDQYAGQDPVADLAIDVLGSILRGSQTDPPYPEVFSFLEKAGVTDQAAVKPATLVAFSEHSFGSRLRCSCRSHSFCEQDPPQLYTSAINQGQMWTSAAHINVSMTLA